MYHRLGSKACDWLLAASWVARSLLSIVRGLHASCPWGIGKLLSSSELKIESPEAREPAFLRAASVYEDRVIAIAGHAVITVMTARLRVGRSGIFRQQLDPLTGAGPRVEGSEYSFFNGSHCLAAVVGEEVEIAIQHC